MKLMSVLWLTFSGLLNHFIPFHFSVSLFGNKHIHSAAFVKYFMQHQVKDYFVSNSRSLEQKCFSAICIYSSTSILLFVCVLGAKILEAGIVCVFQKRQKPFLSTGYDGRLQQFRFSLNPLALMHLLCLNFTQTLLNFLTQPPRRSVCLMLPWQRGRA